MFRPAIDVVLTSRENGAAMRRISADSRAAVPAATWLSGRRYDSHGGGRSVAGFAPEGAVSRGWQIWPEFRGARDWGHRPA